MNKDNCLLKIMFLLSQASEYFLRWQTQCSPWNPLGKGQKYHRNDNLSQFQIQKIRKKEGREEDWKWFLSGLSCACLARFWAWRARNPSFSVENGIFEAFLRQPLPLETIRKRTLAIWLVEISCTETKNIHINIECLRITLALNDYLFNYFVIDAVLGLVEGESVFHQISCID